LRLRLTRKFAEMINGVDLSRARCGEVIDVTEHDGAVLMAEGWAVPAPLAESFPRAGAADLSHKPPPRNTPS